MSALLLAALAGMVGSPAQLTLERAGILVEGAFSDEELTDLSAALEALPPALRRVPGGPLRLHLHAEQAPLGLGDSSAGLPDWSEGHGRFHLYRASSASEPTVAARLAGLSGEQHRALWLRRGLVHAVMQRWEDRLGLTRTPRFKQVTGWVDAFERPLTWRATPLNTFDGAYSRLRGKATPALDLVTFAEELFVPPQAVGAAQAADDGIRCRELSKSRFLLEALDARGLLNGSTVKPARPPCPAFDAWAQLPSLSHVEALFVAASGRRPESLFGHLALQLVRKESDQVRGPSFDSVIQLIALTGEAEGGLEYAVRGLAGGFSASVVTTAMAGMAHQTLEREQRSMRRYRIELDDVERERFMERTFELERRGYFDYYFFTDNCATLLVLLLNAALEPERAVKLPSRFGPTLPGAVLDAVLAAQARDGRPLLTYVPDTLESTRDLAERAERLRQARVEAFSARAPPALRTALREVHSGTTSPLGPTRSRAYARLPGLGDAVAAAGDPALLADLYDYLAQTVRVERYAYDRAVQEVLQDAKLRRQVRLAQASSAGAVAAARTAQRQRSFRDERTLAAGRLVLDQAQESEELLREETTGSPEAEALRQEALEARARFERLAQLHGELVDRHFDSVDAQAWRSDDHARKVADEAQAAEAALLRSGFARTWVAAGSSLGGSPRAELVLHSAMLSEELGELRLNGFQASSELKVLDGELAVRPTAQWLELYRSELTLVGYRTLRRELAAHRRDALDELGWGFSAGWDFDLQRAHTHRAMVRGEGLVILQQGADFSGFTALGVGAFASLRWGGREATPVAGPRVSVAHRTHLFGSVANAVRVEAAYEPGLDPRLAWVHQLRAEVRLELLVASVEGWSVRTGPQAVAEVELWPSEGPARTTARLLWQVELL